MFQRNLLAIVTGAAALMLTCSAAQAFDDSKYPDFKGQWVRKGSPNWLLPPGEVANQANYETRPALPDIPPGLFTPEYQAIYDANRADQAAGGVGNVPSTFCIPQGMPMMMDIYDPMEIVVTPDTTYILISHINDSYRRIYTDGRDWPKEAAPTYAGYSIGHWVDEDGDGRYDALEIETRNFLGPRAYDATGLPLAHDNESIIKERIHLDKADPNIIYNEITVTDHALTHPWSISKKAFRSPNPRPVWNSDVCPATNTWIRIGEEPYFLSADGKLMPTKKDQPPPDLSYFKQR